MQHFFVIMLRWPDGTTSALAAEPDATTLDRSLWPDAQATFDQYAALLEEHPECECSEELGVYNRRAKARAACRALEFHVGLQRSKPVVVQLGKALRDMSRKPTGFTPMMRGPAVPEWTAFGRTTTRREAARQQVRDEKNSDLRNGYTGYVYRVRTDYE